MPIYNAQIQVIEMLGKSTFSDSQGAFKFDLEGISKKYLEFQVFHSNYQTQNFKVLINFQNNQEQSLEKFLLKKRKEAKP